MKFKPLVILLLTVLFSCSDHTSQKASESSDRTAANEYSIEMPEDVAEEIVVEMESADFDEEISIDDADAKKEISKKTPKTWKRSEKTANDATLFIGDKEKLDLKGAQIGVTVDGFRARVLIDWFFYSDKQSQLEGTFKMKLPQDASPYYFAFGESVVIDKTDENEPIPFVQYNEFDFSEKGIEKMRSDNWTQPKVARVVPKQKAAFAYGQTVRRQVDPALAEWAGADIFNFNVFPIAPNKLHRIVIGYDVNLTQLQNDWILDFPVPKVECPLIIDFDVANIAGIEKIIQPVHNAKQKRGRTAFQLINPKEDNITVRYEGLKNIALNTASDDQNESYFSASLSPALPSTTNSGFTQNAVIALDLSLSSNPDKFNVWLKMTEALLTNNPTKIKTFNVLLFNIEAFWWKESPVANSQDNINAFLSFAQQLVLEGASDIGLALTEIADRSFFKNQPVNTFLLSDGADTWGEGDSHELAQMIKNNDAVFAFNTGMSGTSTRKLNHLARSSGGALFSINGEEEVNKASTAFRSKPWKIESFSIDGNEDILMAGGLTYLYPSQKLMIAGRGKLEAKTKVELKLSQGDQIKTIQIPIEKTLGSKLTPRIYGQMATSQLEEMGYFTENQSIAYARHFKVPGNTCSLLMLETEEDYKQYNINATEDAFVVKSSPVTSILNSVKSTMALSLKSAKAKFKLWLEKLSKTDGVDFQIPTALNIVVDRIKEADFRIKQQHISCSTRKKNEVSEVILQQLFKAELDYDVINTEAQKRAQNEHNSDALRVLSSVVEKNPGNTVLVRDVAFMALEWNLNAQAYYLFRRVLKSRVYEPQTYLALAQTLRKMENRELALVYYEICVYTKWDGRFGEFRKIATLDYLNFLDEVKNNNFSLADYAELRYESLRGEFNEHYADLMVTISWNTDNTDVDLHIIEPTGEECFYSHPNTKIGGHLTNDVTQGYGPEMYLLKDAKKGEYKIRVKYFSSNRNRTSTRTKIYATVYKNWGKKNETAATKVVTLSDNKEMHDIDIIKF